MSWHSLTVVNGYWHIDADAWKKTGMGLQLYKLQSQGQPKPLALQPWTSLIFNFLWPFVSGRAVPAQITPNWTKC